MAHRSIARTGAISTALAILLALGLATETLAAVAWSPRYPVPAGTLSFLARTYGPGVGWEHVLRASGGYLATSRSADGRSWATPVRLTGFARGTVGLAASGPRLYAVWAVPEFVEQEIVATSVSFRTSPRHGAPSTWTARKSLRSWGSAIDGLRVAAIGSRVVVGISGGGLGPGQVALLISDDHGTTWTEVSAGSGRLVGLAISSTTIAVAIEGDSGTTISTSSNDGATWSPDIDLAGHPRVSMAGSSRAIAVAWADGPELGPTGVFIRLWSGAWGATRTVAQFDRTTVGMGQGPVVSIAGSTTVGVAWSRVRPAAGSYEDLMWRESADGGATWRPAVVLKYAVRSGPEWSNAPLAVGWAATRIRFVLFQSGGPVTKTRYLRVGTGTP